MLLSLFEESQGDDPENSSSNEREDNLDDLFDEDDVEDGEGYVEPEEEEDLTLEKSSTDAEKEHNRSKEDLEGKWVTFLDVAIASHLV